MTNNHAIVAPSRSAIRDRLSAIGAQYAASSWPLVASIWSDERVLHPLLAPGRPGSLSSQAPLPRVGSVAALGPRADGSAVSLAACGAASPAEVFTGAATTSSATAPLSSSAAAGRRCCWRGLRVCILAIGRGRDAALVLDVNLQSATTASPSALGMAVASSAEPLRSFGEARRDDGAAIVGMVISDELDAWACLAGNLGTCLGRPWSDGV